MTPERLLHIRRLAEVAIPESIAGTELREVLEEIDRLHGLLFEISRIPPRALDDHREMNVRISKLLQTMKRSRT